MGKFVVGLLFATGQPLSKSLGGRWGGWLLMEAEVQSLEWEDADVDVDALEVGLEAS